MTEMGAKVLIPDKEWPQMLAQSLHIAVKALEEAGVRFTDIYNSEPERVIDSGIEKITGWSIDVIGEKEE